MLRKKKFEKDLTNDKSKKTSADWLKTAGYLDTKDQDPTNYIFVPPKKAEENKIPADPSHFIRSEIEASNFKKSNLASKITAKNIVNKCKKLSRKHPYNVPNIVLEEPTNTEDLDKLIQQKHQKTLLLCSQVKMLSLLLKK